MVPPALTLCPETAVDEALDRWQPAGSPALAGSTAVAGTEILRPAVLWVVDASNWLVGSTSQRDLALAQHYGFGAAPVSGHMEAQPRAIAPDTPLAEIKFLMTTHALSALPVVDRGQLVGVVTQAAVGTVPMAPSNPMSHTVLLPILQQRLVPELWQVLTVAALLAGQRNWHLYVVGGAVRDLLRALFEGHANAGGLLLEDVDLVVDGGDRPMDAGAGVELATALQVWYPAARLEVYGQFQTAALRWQEDPVLRSLSLDMATARTEVYAHPAANPTVAASSLRQDLYRRDFTMNAMALRLTGSGLGEQTGELVDFFGGVEDLQERQVRVLHANSFIEDPTRIFRAVRFAVRLGFQLEAQTERWLRYALASGIYAQVLEQQAIAPALQTRLKAELKYLLQTDYWQPALLQLAHLGALRCLHPTLVLDRTLWRQLRLTARLHQRFVALAGAPRSLPALWELLLGVIIAHLDPPQRQTVARNLQVEAEQMGAIVTIHLPAAEPVILSALEACQRPSQVWRLLKPYGSLLLTLIAVRCVPTTHRGQRRLIWRYLTQWSQMQPLLDGNDLKQLGYAPGPQFRQMLEAVAGATVDQVVTSRAEAIAFVTEIFRSARF